MSLNDFPDIKSFSRFLEDLYNLHVVKFKGKMRTGIYSYRNLISLGVHFPIDDNLKENLGKFISFLNDYHVPLDTIFSRIIKEDKSRALTNKVFLQVLQDTHKTYNIGQFLDSLGSFINDYIRRQEVLLVKTANKSSLQNIKNDIYIIPVTLRRSHLEKITEKKVSHLFQNGCFLDIPTNIDYYDEKTESFRLEVCGPDKPAAVRTGNGLNAIIGYTKKEQEDILNNQEKIRQLQPDVFNHVLTKFLDPPSEPIIIGKTRNYRDINIGQTDFMRKIKFLAKLYTVKQKLKLLDNNTFGFRNKTSRKRKNNRKNNRKSKKSKKPSTKSRKSKKDKPVRKSKNNRNSKKSKHSRKSRKNKKSNKLRKRNRKSRK